MLKDDADDNFMRRFFALRDAKREVRRPSYFSLYFNALGPMGCAPELLKFFALRVTPPAHPKPDFSENVSA